MAIRYDISRRQEIDEALAYVPPVGGRLADLNRQVCVTEALRRVILIEYPGRGYTQAPDEEQPILRQAQHGFVGQNVGPVAEGPHESEKATAGRPGVGTQEVVEHYTPRMGLGKLAGEHRLAGGTQAHHDGNRVHVKKMTLTM